MENLISEVDFAALKDNFDAICDKVNNQGESAALCLSSGRKAYILPEEAYGNVSHMLLFKTRL